MKNSKASINLFKSRKKGFLDNFMKWALGIGRVLVILTEAIALLAFLYRFSLDRNLIDLHDEIKQQQAIVKLSKNNEDNYRDLQARLAEAKLLTEEGNQTAKISTDILQFASSDIIFTSFIVSNTSVKLQTEMQSLSSLKDFANKLKQYPAISSVSIDRIENRTTDAKIIVGITATIKEIATQSAFIKLEN